jgi:hypothetical protein
LKFLPETFAKDPQKLCRKRREHSFVEPGYIAEEYAFVGDKDHALEWLEKAFQEKSEEMTVLRIRRCFDFLRSDPRYRDLERRVGFTW